MKSQTTEQRCYVAIDLGATSGRVVIARLKEVLLAMQEVHRFQNAPEKLVYAADDSGATVIGLRS